MKRPYRTKKRREEFMLAYSLIGKLNRYCSGLEIEIECFERHENFVEANSRRELLETFRNELKKYKLQEWDTDYFNEPLDF